jgi:protein-tyrosine phosphatase
MSLSIPDYTVPSFEKLKTAHDIISQSQEKVYVHCKGGHDRTGVVVATYFIHAGLSPTLAKQKFYEVFLPPVRGRYPHSPLIETRWKVLQEYEQFLKR